MTLYPARALVAASAAAFGLLLAACNSNAPGPAAINASPLDTSSTSSTSAAPIPTTTAVAAATSGSCGLVTAGDVGTATGHEMSQGADAGAICSYSAVGDPSTVVYVQLYTDAQSMAATKATEPGSEHLDGLGDDAFWTAAGTVFVQKGSRGLTISLPSLALTSTTAPTAVLALAKIAAGRL